MLEAAAATYGLDFIALTHGTYYLALRRAQLENASVRTLVTCKKSAT